MEIKLSKEEELFLKKYATIITSSDGTYYFHLPFWFEKIDHKGNYKMFGQEKLPSGLIKKINELKK